MAGISVGSVSVRVVPDAQRFTRDLEAQIGGVARKFGQQLGKDLGEQVGKPIAEQVEQSISKVASDVGKTVGGRMGKDMGNGIAQGMAEGAKKGAKDVSDSGKDAGGAFSREFNKAVQKALADLPSDKRLGVSVTADDKGAIDNLKRRLASLSNKNIGVDIVAESAIAELKEIEAELNRIGRKQTTATVDVRTDLETAQNDLAKFRTRASQEGDQAGQNYGGAFERKVREAIGKAVNSLPDIELKANTSSAEQDLKRLRDQLAALRDRTVSIKGDSSAFQSDFARVSSALNELRGSDATANIRADAGEALRNMGEVEAFLRKIDGQSATAHVNVDDNGSAYVVDTNVSRLLNRLLLFGSAGTGIAALVGPLLAVAGAAGVAAAALGAGVLAFGGIGDAVKALNDEQSKSGEEAEKAAKKQATSANQIASAQDRLGQASRNVGVVQANVADQAISASNRVRDAEERVEQVREQATRKAQQAAEAVSNASRRVESVRRDAADRQLSDLRSVRRAEEALQDAQRDSTVAQRALTAARKEANRQLEDMQSNVVDNALAQRGAALDLIEARQELAKSNSDPSATFIDRARAQLAYDEAIQRTKELSRDGQRLGQDYAEASVKGVEGSEAVTAAQGRIADSAKTVRNAQESLADAQRTYAKNRVSDNEAINDAVRNLAKAQADQAQVAVDNARSIRDAEQSRDEAYRQQASQQRQGAEQIRNAQQQVIEAQRALQNAYTQAGDSGVSAADKVKQAFADLSPTQAAFARFLFGLKDEYLALRAAAAEGFLPGAQAGIESLLTRFNDFKIVLGQLGAAGGTFVKQLGDQMASPYFTSFWRMMGDLSGPIMSGLADSVGRVAKSTADWVTELLPLTGIGLDSLNSLSDYFANFAPSLPGIAIPLNFAFQDILDDLEPLGPALVAAANAFAYMGRVLSSLIGGALTAFTPVLNAAAGALAIIAGILEGLPSSLLAVLVGLLALRIAKTIFGDFRKAIDYTRKSYPAFGKDTRLAGETQRGLADEFGNAGNQARKAGNAFKAGGTDSAASSRQHLLLRTAVRDVAGAYSFASQAAEKARAAYARGQKDAERYQKAADFAGDKVTSGLRATGTAFRSFADSADSAATRTGQSFYKMAGDVNEAMRNARTDAARGVNLGRKDNEVASPGIDLDMGDFAGTESLVTRLARTFTRFTTASEEFSSGAARSFAKVRNVIHDTMEAGTAAIGGGMRGINRGLDALQLGTSRASGELVRLRDVFQSQGFKATGTELGRTFVAAKDGVVSATRSFVAEAGSMGRTFVAAKDGVVQDASTISSALVRMDKQGQGTGSRLGQVFANLADRQFPGLREEVVGFGRDATNAINGFAGRFKQMSREFGDVGNVFIAGTDGIHRGLQDTEKASSRAFRGIESMVEVGRRFVAGAEGIERQSVKVNTAFKGLEEQTGKAVVPFKNAGDRAYEMGNILGTLGSTLKVSSDRIGKAFLGVGTDAEAGTGRAGRVFSAFRDSVSEISLSTAVALRRTAAVVRNDVPASAENAQRRTALALNNIRESFRLTEARAQLTAGNIGGALATVSTGAFETAMSRIRGSAVGAAGDAEQSAGRIRAALGQGGPLSAGLAAAIYQAANARTAMGETFRSIPELAGRAVNTSIGHVGRFVGVLSGSLRAGLSLAGSAVQGLWEAIGGGAGVAIGIAGAAFTAYLGYLQRAEQRQTAARQAALGYADELRRSNGAITENIRQTAQQTLITDGVADAAKRAGITTQQLTDAALNGGPEFERYRGQLAATGGGAGDLGQAFQGLLYTLGISDNSLAASADNFDKVRDSMVRARELVKQLPALLAETITKFQDQGSAAQETVRNNDNWTTAIKNLGDESKSADDKVSALSQALLGMTDPQAKARQAARDSADTFRELPKLFGDAAGAINRTTGEIDLNSESGSKLSGELDKLRQAFGDTYGAEFNKAISSGKSFQEAGKIASDSTAGIRDRFIEVARQAGVTRDAAERMAREFGLIPKDVPVELRFNAGSIFTEITDLQKQLGELRKGATINIKAPTAEAASALQNLGFDVVNLPDGTVNITAKDDSARATMAGVIAFGNSLRADPTLGANPQVFSDTLLAKINEANAAIGIPGLSANDARFREILDFTLTRAGTLFGVPGIGGDPNRPGGFWPTFEDVKKRAEQQKITIGIAGRDELTAGLRNLVDLWNGVGIDLKVRPNVPGQPVDPAKPPPVFIPGLSRAVGGVVEFMAAGGVRAMSSGTATTVPPNTPTLIGDRRKDDEAYIPINRDARSIAILTDTAARMGFTITPMAMGGILGSAVGMAAGGVKAATPAATAAVPTIDPAAQQAAAAATNTLNAALQGQASTLIALTPAVAAQQLATQQQQLATTTLATDNTAVLLPALQTLLAAGLWPLVTQLNTMMMPSLANYQLQTGTNNVLANQAFQGSQVATQLSTITTADNIARNSLNMAISTTSFSTIGQQQHEMFRAAEVMTQTQTTNSMSGMTADMVAFVGFLRDAIVPSVQGSLGTMGQAFLNLNDYVQTRMGDLNMIVGSAIRFMISTILGDPGLIGAWNNLNGQFGLNKPVRAFVPGFASGGKIPGSGAGTADDVPIMASSGEFMVREKIARQHYPFLKALNSGQAEARQAAGGSRARMPGYAGGGIIESVERAKRFAAGESGKPYQWAGVGNPSWDCSGFMSGITNVLNNKNPRSRIGSTGDFPWSGFAPGLTSQFAIGSTANAGNGIGHMAGTLGGVGAESAGAPKGVNFGGPARTAENSLFSVRASLGTAGGEFVSAGPGGGESFDPTPMVNEAFAETYRLLNDQFPAQFGTALSQSMTQDVGRQMVDGSKNKMVEQLSAMFASSGAAMGPLGAGAAFFTSQISQAAKMTGVGKDGAIIGVMTAIAESRMKMLANAARPDSLKFPHEGLGADHDSVGLFQQRANGAWGGTAEQMNPLASAINFFRALLRFDWRGMEPGAAAQRVQGSAVPGAYSPNLGRAQQLVNQFGGFDDGGIASGTGLMAKAVMAPERVLSPQQTRAFDTLVNHISEKDLLKVAQTPTSSGGERTINVYPRENQSEMSIATAVRRVDSFESRLR